jgi:hypothetical protein
MVDTDSAIFTTTTRDFANFTATRIGPDHSSREITTEVQLTRSKIVKVYVGRFADDANGRRIIHTALGKLQRAFKHYMQIILLINRIVIDEQLITKEIGDNILQRALPQAEVIFVQDYPSTVSRRDQPKQDGAIEAFLYGRESMWQKKGFCKTVAC